MTKEIEVEKGKVDFKHLFKIKEINIDIVTLVKFEIKTEMSLANTNMIKVVLKDIIGTETYKVHPDVLLELAGKTGELIKKFEVKKFISYVKISKITWI